MPRVLCPLACAVFLLHALASSAIAQPATPKPGPDWVAVGDGWVPPSHPLAQAGVDNGAKVQARKHLVGTWQWLQGATLIDPMSGQPFDGPLEQFGVPSILRLNEDGSAIDLCGFLNPQSRGTPYTLALGTMTLTLTVPWNASEGLGNWTVGEQGPVLTWHKMLFGEDGRVVGYAMVALTLTSVTETSFDGRTVVLFFDPAGAPLERVLIEGAPPVSGLMGPARGQKLPLVAPAR